MTTSRSRRRQEPPLPNTRPAPADVALVGPPGRERPQQRGPLQKAPDGPSAAILTVFGLLVVLWLLGGSGDATQMAESMLLPPLLSYEIVARLREAEAPGARAAARDAAIDAGNDMVEIVAVARYAFALTHGLDAAVSENGDTFSDREARAIAETIGNFGLAVAASADTTHQRCELSGFQCPCRTYTFHVRAEGE